MIWKLHKFKSVFPCWFWGILQSVELLGTLFYLTHSCMGTLKIGKWENRRPDWQEQNCSTANMFFQISLKWLKHTFSEYENIRCLAVVIKGFLQTFCWRTAIEIKRIFCYAADWRWLQMIGAYSSEVNYYSKHELLMVNS